VDDLQRLAEHLAPVETGAVRLPWGKQRPWRTATHLWVRGRVLTVDLHDLGRALALQVVDALPWAAENLDTGALRLITGRGRHSVTGPVLPGLVRDRLRELSEDHDWTWRMDGAGRLVVIWDPDRAPPAARGALPLWIWLWLAGMAAVLLATCLRRMAA